MTERRGVVIESENSFFARARRDPGGPGTGERKDAGASQSFETFSAAILHRWLPELAAATGRTEDDLQATGLHLSMFKTAGVRVDFDDGSTMSFNHAFALRSSGDDGLAAIFTEHCGHYEVELGMYDKLEVAELSSTADDIRVDQSDPRKVNHPIAGQ